MIKINPQSINDLLILKQAGVPVTLTSHPGNASLYKLVLWSCGIPEHLWDITCCKADANNWPMHRLISGQAELLIASELHRRVVSETNPGHRFVTAYQSTVDGVRLGRFHVQAMQACFPRVISSCSRLLLAEARRIEEMFEFLADTKRAEVFSRYIDSDGIMRPIAYSSINPQDLARSFMNVLKELDHLLFSDEPIIPKGGACYDGAMVPLAGMLVQYWQTGRTERYDISGPDMIHYAMRSEHQLELTKMLDHLRKWNSSLIPPTITVQMFPGTVARVGHIRGHISEAVMKRKLYVLRNHQLLQRKQKELLWEDAREDNKHWPIEINPSAAPYFSQYDLVRQGVDISIDDFWKDLPIGSIRESLLRANALLRI